VNLESAKAIFTDSTAIAPDIFEYPRARSVNAIGISLMAQPARHARWFISSWNEYPALATDLRSILSSAARRQHLNPPVTSFTGIPVMTRMNIPPARETRRLLNGQPGVEPPRT